MSNHLQALADAGDEWPAATPVERVQALPPEFAFLVDVEVEDTPVRVNISLGEQLLKRLDAAAVASGATRSGFIAQAVRAQLGERRAMASEFEGAARRLQDELTAVGRKINDSLRTGVRPSTAAWRASTTGSASRSARPPTMSRPPWCAVATPRRAGRRPGPHDALAEHSAR